MEYPWNFPDEAIAEVERVQIETREHLEQQTKSTSWSRRKRGADEANFRKYVLRVFLAFGQEACKLGMDGEWRVDKIRSQACEFLIKFWREAYDDFHERLVISPPSYTRSWSHLEWEFGRSADWGQFKNCLLAVAKAKGKPPAQHAPEATSETAVQDCARERRAAVDAYIDEVLKKKGKRITRTDIWRRAGYKSRTVFECWQRSDPKRRNKVADERFKAILREKPHLK